jgi:uncharacterized protein
MHPDLEKVIRLQRADSEFRRVEAALADIPRRTVETDGRLAAERQRLDAAREAMAHSQKGRRQKESELQDLEGRRSKYKGQLMEVKTNKEYTAMLHEIEAVEREIREREDQILQEMERGEALVLDVKREEAVFKEVEERHRGEVRVIQDEGRALGAEAERHRAERDAVAASLSQEALDLFNRVARLRGSGLAEARDEMCQACHVKLRPQMYVDIRRNDTLVQCPSCSRILYFEPPVPTVDFQP